MTAKIGYRTHAELMQAWDLLRLIAFNESLFGCWCRWCGSSEHTDECLIKKAQVLLVDPPQSDPVAHANHLSVA